MEEKRKVGRPKAHNAEDIIAWAKEFKHKFGYFPGRDDLKGDARKAYIERHNFNMYHATSIERVFGSWSDFRIACGEAASIHTPTTITEQVSMTYMVEQYGMIATSGEQDVVDGYIGDSRIEVKSAILRRKTEGQKRFRWALHKREYSKLVDEMALIGCDEDGNVLLDIRISSKGEIAALIDNRNTVEIPYSALVTGMCKAPLWNYVLKYVPQD